MHRRRLESNLLALYGRGVALQAVHLMTLSWAHYKNLLTKIMFRPLPSLLHQHWNKSIGSLRHKQPSEWLKKNVCSCWIRSHYCRGIELQHVCHQPLQCNLGTAIGFGIPFQFHSIPLQCWEPAIKIETNINPKFFFCFFFLSLTSLIRMRHHLRMAFHLTWKVTLNMIETSRAKR